MLLLTVFACISLGLAALGIYSVMAYLVTQGTREIGIRMALGASQNAILSLVVRKGMTLALCGVAVGIVGAFALTRVLHSLLFGVRSNRCADLLRDPAAVDIDCAAGQLHSRSPRRARRSGSVATIRLAQDRFRRVWGGAAPFGCAQGRLSALQERPLRSRL